MRRLNVIGAGKLGRSLACLWARERVFEIHDVVASRLESAQAAVDFIGAGRAVDSIAAMHAAEVWLIAVPDDRIGRCCATLASSGVLRTGDTVFHGSGSLAASELVSASRAGAHVASAHPVKSIAAPGQAVESFAGTWCGVEGDAQALAVLRPAFEAIGARLFDIDPASKTIYHAASVIVSNCLVALLQAGVRCYEHAGVAPSIALQVTDVLARVTLDNVVRLGSMRALTGPIARGDHAVVARELEALAEWEPQIAALYRELGLATLELARAQGKADAAALAVIERTLTGRS